MKRIALLRRWVFNLFISSSHLLKCDFQLHVCFYRSTLSPQKNPKYIFFIYIFSDTPQLIMIGFL